jgi:hypothetical protein
LTKRQIDKTARRQFFCHSKHLLELLLDEEKNKESTEIKKFQKIQNSSININVRTSSGNPVKRSGSKSTHCFMQGTLTEGKGSERFTSSLG